MLLAFECNICGAHNPVSTMHRELAPCVVCGANARFRAMIVGLSMGLYGRILRLDEMLPDFGVRGFGCSDSAVYAERLATRFDYVNTFLDAEPRLDVCDPATLTPFQDCRFILCSDVLEHVLPQPAEAIRNMYACLAPGGCLVASAPTYDIAETIEKYPELRDYKVVAIGERHAVVYEQVMGALGFDPEPIFHGGPGSVLEMRLFSHTVLLETFWEEGFRTVLVIGEEATPYGAVWPRLVERVDVSGPLDGRVIVGIK